MSLVSVLFRVTVQVVVIKFEKEKKRKWLSDACRAYGRHTLRLMYYQHLLFWRYRNTIMHHITEQMDLPSSTCPAPIL